MSVHTWTSRKGHSTKRKCSAREKWQSPHFFAETERGWGGELRASVLACSTDVGIHETNSVGYSMLFFHFRGLTFFSISQQGEGRECRKETECGRGLGS